MTIKKYGGHVIASKSTIKLTPEGARRARKGEMFFSTWWNGSHRISPVYRVKKGSHEPDENLGPVKFASHLTVPRASTGSSGG